MCTPIISKENNPKVNQETQSMEDQLLKNAYQQTQSMEDQLLKNAYQQTRLDLLVTRRRLDAANALLDSMSEETGRLLNLNGLIEGAHVIFRTTLPGVVLTTSNHLLGEYDNVVRVTA